MASRHHTWLKHSIWVWHLVWITSSTPFRVNIDTTRADLATNYTWRSSISSGRCAGLECSAGLCQNYWIVYCVQATDKNATVQGIFQWWPNMTASVVTVTVDCRYVKFAVCAVHLQHFCDSVTLIFACIILIIIIILLKSTDFIRRWTWSGWCI